MSKVMSKSNARRRITNKLEVIAFKNLKEKKLNTKSHIQETLNLSIDADNRTNTKNKKMVEFELF